MILESSEIKDGMEVWYGIFEFSSYGGKNKLTNRPDYVTKPCKYIVKIEGAYYNLFNISDNRLEFTIYFNMYGDSSSRNKSTRHCFYATKEDFVEDVNRIFNAEILRRCNVLEDTTQSLDYYRQMIIK